MVGSESQRENALKEIMFSLDLADKESCHEQMRVRAEMAECRVIDEIIAHLHVKRRCAPAVRALRRLLTVPAEYKVKSEGVDLQKQLWWYCITRGVTFVLSENLTGAGKYPKDLILGFLMEAFMMNGRALVRTLARKPALFAQIVGQLEKDPSADALLRLVGEQDRLPRRVVRLYMKHRMEIPLKDGYWRSKALRQVGTEIYVEEKEDKEEAPEEIELTKCEKRTKTCIHVMIFLRRYGFLVIPLLLIVVSVPYQTAWCSAPLSNMVAAHNFVVILLYWGFLRAAAVVRRMVANAEEDAKEGGARGGERPPPVAYLWCCLGCFGTTIHGALWGGTLYITLVTPSGPNEQATAEAGGCTAGLIQLGQLSAAVWVLHAIYWVIKHLLLLFCNGKKTQQPEERAEEELRRGSLSRPPLLKKQSSEESIPDIL